MGDQPTTEDLVLATLREAGGPLSPSDLQERVDRSPRSVRGALRALEEAGEIEWSLDPRDPRYRLYRVVDSEAGDQPARENAPTCPEG